MAKVIDSHHHLWRYTSEEFGWIGDEMQALRRDFLLTDLQQTAPTAGVDSSVVVQARQTIEETRWLLACANESQIIQGVVGWLPLVDPDLPALLREFSDVPYLKGLRHVIQDEPDELFMLREDFNRGIDFLSESNLVFDILIHEQTLPVAIDFVRRHPHQTFVLDHLAKPKIRAREMQPWRDNLKRLADFENVVCKCSGLVTESEWSSWTIDDVQPYLDTALEAFGADRLMCGSDWPVCLVATEYSRWWSTLRTWALNLNETQRDNFLGGTAQRIYQVAENC